jgi:hypothetical protein
MTCAMRGAAIWITGQGVGSADAPPLCPADCFSVAAGVGVADSEPDGSPESLGSAEQEARTAVIAKSVPADLIQVVPQ